MKTPIPHTSRKSVAKHATGAANDHRIDSVAKKEIQSWHAFSRSKPSIVLGTITAFLFLVGNISAAVYRISTEQGRFVIETFDPNIEVLVKGEGKEVTISDPKSGQQIVLKSGNYSVELTKGADGLSLDTDHFTLKRGNQITVRVSRDEGDPNKTTPAQTSAPKTAKFGERSPLVAELRSVNKADLANLLEGQIRSAEQSAKQFEGTGHVITGQVKLVGGEDPRTVLAQMRILPEGYFAGEVKGAGQPVGFRFHGYEPVDIVPRADPGTVEHVGVVEMKPVPQSELAKISGSIQVEERAGRPSMKDIRLVAGIEQGPVNTPSNGYSARSGHEWPQPISIALNENGDFSATGFSPTEYYLKVTAPRCVEQYIPVRLERGKLKTVAPIHLEVARKISVEYVVADEANFANLKPKTRALFGGDHWQAGEKADQYGSDLKFKQSGGTIRFQSVYQPAEIADIGNGALNDFLQVDSSKYRFQNPNDVVVESGHVYLLNHHQTWKHWVLFRVTTE